MKALTPLFLRAWPRDWTRGLQGGDAAECTILGSDSQDITEQPFLFIWPHGVQHPSPGGLLFCPPIMSGTKLPLGHHQSPSFRVIQGLGENPEEEGTSKNHSSGLPLEQTMVKKREVLSGQGRGRLPDKQNKVSP